MRVGLKRAYERATASDGTRVLVDRLWPRGLTKDAVRLDAWLKEIAPSDALRKWFHANPAGWSKFREKYLAELRSDAAQNALHALHELRENHARLTLLFASKNTERNNALVLKELLDGERKPPKGTGPARAAASGLKQARAARRR